MTCVMTIQPITFNTKKVSGKIVKGIDKGGLYGLMKHNNREEYLDEYEVKTKRNTHIDKSKEHLNHYFKRMDASKIEKLKATKHRVNQRGAFQMIYSFQDLEIEEANQFYDKEFAKDKAKLIVEFLKQEGIIERFELLDLICHNDEGMQGGDTQHPHFHLTFSAFDKINKDWGYKDFFSPTVGQKPMVKNGEVQYKKIKNGKDRGKYLLDEHGNKIPKMKDVEAPIFQKLQDNWNDFLIAKKQPYRNKKEFTSLIQLPSSIWRKLSPEKKEEVYKIRKLQNKMDRAYFSDNMKLYESLKKEIVSLLAEVMIDIERIQKKLHIKL